MINPKSVFICIAVLLMPFVSSGQEKSVTVTPGKSCPEEEFKAIMARHNAVGLAEDYLGQIIWNQRNVKTKTKFPILLDVELFALDHDVDKQA